eukprot:scaffold50389_cov69-Phaeocystis_antarctica.AAC.5
MARPTLAPPSPPALLGRATSRASCGPSSAERWPRPSTCRGRYPVLKPIVSGCNAPCSALCHACCAALDVLCTRCTALDANIL